MTSFPGRFARAAVFRARHFLLLALVVAAAAVPAGAQTRSVKPGTPDATRAELTALARSGAQESSAARDRLATGDFRVGDRIVLSLGNEPRGDTVVVRDEMMVTLSPSIPDMSLRGVLRSELQSSVEAYIRRYVRDPVVRVYPLVRLSVVGGVGRPGFYAMAPDRTLSDVIMFAGGPSGNADYRRVEITRGPDKVVDRKRAERAIREGATLEQLGVAPGDQLKVGERKRDWLQIAQVGLGIVTGLASAYWLIRQIGQ
jgi:protein involved in polysaccharide export with SLBB domain